MKTQQIIKITVKNPIKDINTWLNYDIEIVNLRMEKYCEEKEILTPDLNNKYTIYNDKTGKVKTYMANNRQGQKYRAIKFFKNKNVVNYLGSRKDIRTYLKGKIKEKGVGKDSKEVMFTFIDEAKKFKKKKMKSR